MKHLFLLALALCAALPRAADARQDRESTPEVRDLAGAPQRLDSLRGRVAVVTRIRIDCAACASHLRELSELQRDLAPWGVQVVGIVTDASRDDVAAFVRRTAIAFPVWIAAADGDLAAVGLGSTPETVVLDADGRVVERLAVEGRAGAARRAVDRLVAARRAAPNPVARADAKSAARVPS